MKFFKRIIFTKILNFFVKKNYTLQRYTSKNNIINFYKSIKPVVIQEGLVRIGSQHDGGYLVPNCLGDINFNYSPGVSDNFDFEIDLYTKYGIKSFLADYSIDDHFKEFDYLFFKKKFIGLNNSNTHIRLEDWINENSKEDNNLMLSMDIENDEWTVLLDTPTSNLSKFKILVIEFHNFAKYLVNNDSILFVEYLFQKLKNNFEIVHIHPNNCCGVLEYEELKIPNVVEITFLNKNAINISDENLEIPNKLDFKNILDNEEIVLQKIWDF